jgi:N-acetyl-anhydromuramyl-L-alanine amidase AmpD
MTELFDFMKLSPKEFWKRVDMEGGNASNTVRLLFKTANARKLTQEEAVKCLDALFIDSHRRIREYSEKLSAVYPTKQFTKDRLKTVPGGLWWVDHFTAGINVWSTLNWFSAQKNKSKKYNGASTHFVLDFTGLPFYLIPLMHGAWHEPRKNKDAVSIEMVNPGVVKLDKDSEWCYWPKDYTQKIPKDISLKLQPQRVTDKNGTRFYMPFPAEQIRNNVLLKRIVLAAVGDALERERFSQHSDWRSSKSDMGPLWPLKDVNDAAMDTLPVEQYSLLSRYDLDAPGKQPETGVLEQESPEYGTATPTHDDDTETDTDTVFTVEGVQRQLGIVGYRVAVDGKFGPQTKMAVTKFQAVWNSRHPDDQLVVDGIPGPKTCKALQQAEKEM